MLMRRLSQGTYNQVWPKSGEIFSELHDMDLQVRGSFFKSGALGLNPKNHHVVSVARASLSLQLY